MVGDIYPASLASYFLKNKINIKGAKKYFNGHTETLRCHMEILKSGTSLDKEIPEDASSYILLATFHFLDQKLNSSDTTK